MPSSLPFEDSLNRRPVAAEALDPIGEFPFDLATYALHLAIVVNRQRDIVVERLLRPLGSNSVRNRALSVIRRLQPCTMNDLADFSAADRTTMTRTVDQLVDAGLVVRGAHAGDRRRVLLTLTALGEAAHEQAMALVRRFNDGAVAGVDEDALRAALRVFERIAGNVVADPDRAERLLLRATPPT
jgi:DNA-binding MarR family transcriptional regulator